MQNSRPDPVDSEDSNPHLKYNLANGLGQMVGKPPFGFDGVQARIFPLSANMNQLQNFIESYLNIAPGIVSFYPAMPIVFLQILDYGKMSQTAQASGFVSQREIVFLVPVLRYDTSSKRRVFQEVVNVAPFIYVDNDASLATGREVYGWEKTKISLDSDLNSWLSHSIHRTTLFEVSAMVFPDPGDKTLQVSRSVLRIENETSLGLSSFPPDYRDILNPFVRMGTAATSYMKLWGLLVQNLTAWRIFGYRPPRGIELAAKQLRQSMASMNVITESPTSKIITLKQFRSAQDPRAISYQALVESQMEISRLNDFGLLNDIRTLLGDLSGGYRVGLSSYPGFRVAEKLGLNVVDTVDTGEGHVHTLEPILPFTVDLDMSYTKGDTICWRTTRSPWRTTDSPPAQDDAKTATNVFNEARGSSNQQITGPYRFSNVQAYVLPLLADSTHLMKFIKNFTGNPIYHFRPWGDYVYLIVHCFDRIYSKEFEVAGSAGVNIEFSVPVKAYGKNDKGESELVSTMLVPAYIFTDNSTDAISQREVLGYPTVKGDVEYSPPNWLASRNRTTLVEFSTESMPLAGFEGKSERLLDIYSGLPIPKGDEIRWRNVAEDWLQTLFQELSGKTRKSTKNAPGLNILMQSGLEILASVSGLNRVALNQFRDAKSPNHACYQSAVLVPGMIDAIKNIQEVEEGLHVDILRRKGLPVAETLGLIAKTSELREGVWVDSFEAIRPFLIQMDYSEDNGVELGWRAGSSKWEEAFEVGDWAKRAKRYRHRHHKVEGVLGAETHEHVCENKNVPTNFWPKSGKVSSLRHLKMAWASQIASLGPQLVEAADVIAAVEALQPQYAIESILSKEWGHWGNPRWRRKGVKQKPDFCIPCSTIGHRKVREEFLNRGTPEKWYTLDKDHKPVIVR